MSRTGAKILTLFVLAIFTITLTPSLAMARKIVIKAGHVNPPGGTGSKR